MFFTSDDIRREHETALASLTPEQRRALERLAGARRLAAFNHRRTEDNLAAQFEAEAAHRTLTATCANEMAA